MPNLGAPEIIVILVIVMILFGPSQLPKLGRSLGQTIKEFRGAGRELQNIHDEKD